MEKAPISIPFKTTNIAADGKTTDLTEGDVKNLEMGHITKENFKTAWSKGMDIMSANLAFTRDSFKTVISVEKELSATLTEERIKDNGHRGF